MESNDLVEQAEMAESKQKSLVDELEQVSINNPEEVDFKGTAPEKPKQPASIPRMLKGLGGHSGNSLDLLEGLHGTRSTRQSLSSAVNNNAPQARKNLNETKLMQEELRAQSVEPKTKKPPKKKAKKAGQPGSALEFASEGETPIQASQGASGNDKDFVPDQDTPILQPASTSSRRKTRKMAQMQADVMDIDAGPSEPKRLTWDEKKDIATWVLSQGPHKTRSDIEDPNTVAYFNQMFPGFNFSVTPDGVPVFAPSLTVFEYFSSFLLKVEQYFGHQTGVVKVVIPEGWLYDRVTPTFQPDTPLAKENVRAHRTQIMDNENPESLGHIFEITPHHPDHVSIDNFLGAIAEDYNTIARAWGFENEEVPNDDMWKAFQLATIVTEQSVVTSNCWPNRDEKLFAQNVPATETLRTQLGCDDPHFIDFGGNSLQESSTRKIGVHSPVFDISNAAGTLFGMQMTEIGAYKVAYVHDGGPRVWTVVRPYDFQKIEALVPGTRVCHQSVGHKELSDEGEEVAGVTDYVPKKTLVDNEIEFTKFVQFQGEMVILFPFAYHQGYNVGPNIVETMAYASERWKVFPVVNLVKQCNRGCFKGREPKLVDLGFAKPSLVGPGGRSLSVEEATQQILQQYLAQFRDLKEIPKQ